MITTLTGASHASTPEAGSATAGWAYMRNRGDSEARQRAVFAALRDPIIVTSNVGEVIEFNPAAVTLFGYEARLAGRPVEELLPFVPVPGHVVDEAMTWRGVVTDAAGRTLDLEVSRTTLVDAGNLTSHIYVLHDISEHAELSRLREQLLFNVAHEIRSPLTVLTGVLEILEGEGRTLSEEEFAHLIGSASRTTTRLRRLAEDLLSAGSIQTGRFVVHCLPMKVAVLLEDGIEGVTPLLNRRGQRVRCELMGDDLEVLADFGHAGRVLTNLLTNAAKYSPEGETIVISAEPADGFVRITVQDRGSGISAEEQGGLFERFYRVHSSREKPGVGLGLAIAKGIVEAHGGAIGVSSGSGQGTAVWFTLPRRDPLRRPRR